MGSNRDGKSLRREISVPEGVAVAEWRDQSQDSSLEEGLLKLLREQTQPEEAP